MYIYNNNVIESGHCKNKRQINRNIPNNNISMIEKLLKFSHVKHYFVKIYNT